MIGKLALMLFSGAILGVGSLAAVHAADRDCHYGGYMPGPYWYGVNRFFHSDRQIPYFAEFPPVYYSYPVPRTYGYSPYAYPPGFVTPTLEEVPAGEIIPNPHVPVEPTAHETPERTASHRSAPEPLVVVNPYFQPSSAVASTAVE